MKTNQSFFHSGWINKYSVTAFLFVIWICFFDGKYNLLKQYKLNSQIRKMEVEKEDLNEKLVEARAEYKDLMDNKEKYAREKYFIAKEGEDVFIIESNSQDKKK